MASGTSTAAAAAVPPSLASSTEGSRARWLLKTAFLAVALQAMALGLGWRLVAAGVSPVHAFCCLLALLVQQLWQNPAVSEVLAASGGGFGSLQQPEAQRRLQAALQTAGPAASQWHMLALAAQGAADVAGAVDLAIAPSAVCEAVASLSSAAAGALFLLGAWHDGQRPSYPVILSCWTASSVSCASILTNSTLADAFSADMSEMPLLPLLSAVQLSVLAMLVARCASAFVAAVVRSPGGLVDVESGRLALQLAGAAGLFGAVAMRVSLPLRDFADTFGLGLVRLGTTALTASGWLLDHPLRLRSVAVRSDRDADGATDARTAHLEAVRRRRAAAGRVPAAAPLMVDSRDGGVQGLSALNQALCEDDDGDEAHEFWEETPHGLIRRLAPACPA